MVTVRMEAGKCRETVLPKEKCAPKSFRTLLIGETRRIICCPKGQFDPRGRVRGAKFPGRCRVGTVTHAVVRPPVRGACPVRER